MGELQKMNSTTAQQQQLSLARQQQQPLPLQQPVDEAPTIEDVNAKNSRKLLPKISPNGVSKKVPSRNPKNQKLKPGTVLYKLRVQALAREILWEKYLENLNKLEDVPVPKRALDAISKMTPEELEREGLVPPLREIEILDRVYKGRIY